MNQTERQFHVDCVHSELVDIFSKLMEVRVSDEESRKARKEAIDACMRAKRKMVEAGLDHSVAYRKGIIHEGSNKIYARLPR